MYAETDLKFFVLICADALAPALPTRKKILLLRSRLLFVHKSEYLILPLRPPRIIPYEHYSFPQIIQLQIHFMEISMRCH